jgi:membrane protease YdiL (CAAX protease family)
VETSENLFAESGPYPSQQSSSEPTPDNPPWNAWVAVVVWLLSVALVVVLPSIVVLVYVAPMRGQFDGQAAMVEFVTKDPTAVLLQVVAIIPVHILTLLLSWAVVTRFRTYPFRETLGWKSGGMQWWHYIAILLGIFLLSIAVMSFFPEADNDLLRIVRSSRAAVFVLAAMATFTAPLVEEVVYRGILFSAFQRSFGTGRAVAVVTALFALVHFPQYWPSYSTLLLLTVLSLTLTLVRVRTRNLLPCIILHTVFNGLQSAALIAEPYTRAPIDPSHITQAAIVHLFVQ